MLLSYYIMLLIPKSFTTFYVLHDHMTCVTVMHDVTSHPLSKSKINKNKNKNSNKIKEK